MYEPKRQWPCDGSLIRMHYGTLKWRSSLQEQQGWIRGCAYEAFRIALGLVEKLSDDITAIIDRLHASQHLLALRPFMLQCVLPAVSVKL